MPLILLSASPWHYREREACIIIHIKHQTRTEFLTSKKSGVFPAIICQMAGRVIVKTENTKMPSQLTFYKQGTMRHKNQSNINHREPWKSSRWSFLNLHNDGEKEVELVPGVLVVATGILTIVLVSLHPPLYISHGEHSALVSLNLVIAQWTREVWSSGRRVHHQEVINVRGINKWHWDQGRK